MHEREEKLKIKLKKNKRRGTVREKDNLKKKKVRKGEE
jgi:hypothetical protein